MEKILKNNLIFILFKFLWFIKYMHANVKSNEK